MNQSQERYPFEPGFQEVVLALMARDQKFVSTYQDILKPEYFSLPHLMIMSTILLDYYNKYRNLPTYTSVQEIIASEFGRASTHGAYDQALVAELFALNHTMFTMEKLDEALYAKDHIVAFGKRQAMRLAIQESIPILDDPNQFADILENIKGAMNVGEGHASLGVEVFSSLDKITDILQGDNAYNPKYKVPVGFPTMDANTNGGIGLGESVTLIGGTGQGKSVLAINMTIAAALAGKPVIYICTELDEADNQLRYAARLSDLPIVEIVTGRNPQYSVRIKQYERLKPYIRIKFFPAMTVKMSSVYSFISKICGIEGILPGLIVIDTLDEILPSRRTDSLYTDAGATYSEARNLIRDFKCPGIFAVNTNRVGYYAEDTGAEVVGMSWARVCRSDLTIVINQTHDEAQNGQMRLKVDKSRRGKSQYTIKCHVNYDNCVISEIPQVPQQQPQQPVAA